MQLLKGYNQKYSKTHDENFIYIHHSYYRAVHTLTGKTPYETYFGYLSPLALDIVYGKQEGVREDLIGDALKEEKNVEKIGRAHV